MKGVVLRSGLSCGFLLVCGFVCGGVLVWCCGLVGGGVLLSETLLYCWRELCESGVAGGEFLLLPFLGGGVGGLCEGGWVCSDVLRGVFSAFCRVEVDGCSVVFDVGSEVGAVAEDDAYVEVVVSFPGFLGFAGFFVEAGESCFVLAADGGVDRRVAPDDFAGGELVGALEGLIGFMQCRQGLHRLGCFLFSIIPFKPVFFDKPLNDCFLKVVSVCFDCW